MIAMSEPSRRSRLLLRLGGTVVLAAAVFLVGIYSYAGAYGLNVFFRGGASLWLNVTPDDRRLSAAMRLALSDRTVSATPGTFEWRSIAPGFDVGELPVLATGLEVDRIMLSRVDPSRFRFIVRTSPGNRSLPEWMDELGAALVINGSYFTRDGSPDTPLVSAGVLLGPRGYQAKHGAFVASSAATQIHDLANGDWRAALRGADEAMVSFPLLITSDGAPRITANWRWLANRSFVGQDRAGRIVLGTTVDAFFSLERLAGFLRTAPLDLTLALNLDGGPVASQGVALNGFRRSTCGQWELAARDNQLRLLTPMFAPRTRCWEMPIVLAAVPR
jgi:hypothetical protein